MVSNQFATKITAAVSFFTVVIFLALIGATSWTTARSSCIRKKTLRKLRSREMRQFASVIIYAVIVNLLNIPSIVVAVASIVISSNPELENITMVLDEMRTYQVMGIEIILGKEKSPGRGKSGSKLAVEDLENVLLYPFSFSIALIVVVLESDAAVLSVNANVSYTDQTIVNGSVICIIRVSSAESRGYKVTDGNLTVNGMPKGKLSVIDGEELLAYQTAVSKWTDEISMNVSEALTTHSTVFATTEQRLEALSESSNMPQNENDHEHSDDESDNSEANETGSSDQKMQMPPIPSFCKP
ncbi:unnamed protein product [Anisakis simplex]|uniref:G_PROTEIN_RECEP_F1_2 domain-containing protein n=1 Tax=Anisakis simplex TaxID=6269 RepID=A0A158PP37_ANISI|nr:unnamed protein product [Anisakis simplex]